ncbi:hypothetical protein RRG08_024871 [Elysia crispata]|uniref:Uncharacterized protein n=1 Tax=Elysia crispata TaxID=231223 RepID=A0AAE1CZQ0_9GAST|nr:hypothetical protein RRG08_024871 [Elysia crispata]
MKPAWTVQASSDDRQTIVQSGLEGQRTDNAVTGYCYEAGILQPQNIVAYTKLGYVATVRCGLRMSAEVQATLDKPAVIIRFYDAQTGGRWKEAGTERSVKLDNWPLSNQA